MIRRVRSRCVIHLPLCVAQYVTLCAALSTSWHKVWTDKYKVSPMFPSYRVTSLLLKLERRVSLFRSSHSLLHLSKPRVNRAGCQQPSPRVQVFNHTIKANISFNCGSQPFFKLSYAGNHSYGKHNRYAKVRHAICKQRACVHNLTTANILLNPDYFHALFNPLIYASLVILKSEYPFKTVDPPEKSRAGLL